MNLRLMLRPRGWRFAFRQGEALTLNSVGQRPTSGYPPQQGCRPCIHSMSPLQGFDFIYLLRRALPYAIEYRPFRAETKSVFHLWLKK